MRQKGDFMRNQKLHGIFGTVSYRNDIVIISNSKEIMFYNLFSLKCEKRFRIQNVLGITIDENKDILYYWTTTTIGMISITEKHRIQTYSLNSVLEDKVYEIVSCNVIEGGILIVIRKRKAKQIIVFFDSNEKTFQRIYKTEKKSSIICDMKAFYVINHELQIAKGICNNVICNPLTLSIENVGDFIRGFEISINEIKSKHNCYLLAYCYENRLALVLEGNIFSGKYLLFDTVKQKVVSEFTATTISMPEKIKILWSCKAFLLIYTNHVIVVGFANDTYEIKKIKLNFVKDAIEFPDSKQILFLRALDDGVWFYYD